MRAGISILLPIKAISQYNDIYSTQTTSSHDYTKNKEYSRSASVSAYSIEGTPFQNQMDLNAMNGIQFATLPNESGSTSTELTTDDPWADVENPDDVMPLGSETYILGSFALIFAILYLKKKIKEKKSDQA